MYTNKRGCLMEFKMRNHTTSPYKDDGQQQRILGGGNKAASMKPTPTAKTIAVPKICLHTTTGFTQLRSGSSVS